MFLVAKPFGYKTMENQEGNPASHTSNQLELTNHSPSCNDQSRIVADLSANDEPGLLAETK